MLFEYLKQITLSRYLVKLIFFGLLYNREIYLFSVTEYYFHANLIDGNTLECIVSFQVLNIVLK